ncbi:hypothetical protein BKA69DRAFT_1129649 [Paraphysoderma sedebokerense]|nr:hypothetical protein BKA69DRAFT_1129649 [Paraphysoderma sedebokerense]
MPPKRKRPKATQAQLNAVARKYKIFHIEPVTDEKRPYKRRKPKTPVVSLESDPNLSTIVVDNAVSTALISSVAPVSSSFPSLNPSTSAASAINNSSPTLAESSKPNTSDLYKNPSISSSSGTNHVKAAADSSLPNVQFITSQNDTEHGIQESYGDMNGDDNRIVQYDDVVDNDNFPPCDGPVTVRLNRSDITVGILSEKN